MIMGLGIVSGIHHDSSNLNITSMRNESKNLSIKNPKELDKQDQAKIKGGFDTFGCPPPEGGIIPGFLS